MAKSAMGDGTDGLDTWNGSSRSQAWRLDSFDVPNLSSPVVQSLIGYIFRNLQTGQERDRMAYWLLKSEPDVYSYADLERDGHTIWDGVNNNLALQHIRTMQPGDLALIYHTGDERRATGIAEVVSEPYADPALADPKRAVVDVKPVRSLPQPVTLAQIKQDSSFEGFDLLRISRLSVVPVSPEHWQRILQLAGESS